MKRLLICFMMLLSLTVFMQVTPASAADDQEATIYGMNLNYTAKLNIPSDLDSQYQITGYKRGTSYNVVSGNDSVTVTSRGLVRVNQTIKKDESGRFTNVITPGDAVIEVKYNGKVTANVTVHVIDYAAIYVEQVIDEYIAKNFNEDMSDKEIIDAIAKFAAQYNYDSTGSAASVKAMIIMGSGNHKATTDAVVTLAQKLGYDAWSIDSAKSSYARKLAMIKLHDTYYQVDAGINEAKNDEGYRRYEVENRSSLFRYQLMDNGKAYIVGYDGKDSTGVLEVPSYIDSHPVTLIWEKGLSELDCTKIILPDTMEALSNGAFYGCDKLKEIEIPASVGEFYGAAFQKCSSLESLTVAKGNQTYKSEDNVVYSKDGRTLVAAGALSSLKVPDTVTQIGQYAFYGNTVLRSVEVPSSVTTISTSAFQGCSSLTYVKLSEGLQTIEQLGFASATQLPVIRIPSTVKSIGHSAFGGCSSLTKAYFCGDQPDFPQGSYGTDQIFLSCSLQAYYPYGNTTWDTTNKHSATNLTWGEWNSKIVDSILDAQITLPDETYSYTGEAFTPVVTVTLQGKTLTQDTNYVVSYYDNVNAGTAYVQIIGCGSYEGMLKASFQIQKGLPKMSALVTKDTLIVGQTTSFTGADGCQFESEDPEVASVTTEGVITAVAAGTTTVSAIYAESDNYTEGKVSYKITVITDPNVTPTPAPTATPGAITTATPGAVTTATPGAVTTATPGAITTATPGAVTAAPGESGKPDVPSDSEKPDVTAAPGDSEKPDVTAAPGKSDKPDVTAAPGESDKPDVPSAAPSESNKPNVPTAAPGGSDKPANPSATPDASKKPSATVVPTKKPSSTKAPSSTNDGSGSVTVGSTVTYKNAKYRITGKNTAEFVGIVKGKTVNIPDTITVGGKVYKITSIAAKACRDNTKITKLVIGKNVKKIGKEAFMNCTKLKSINCKTKLLKAGKVKKNAFKGVNKKVVLKVPKAQKSLYKKLFIF